MAIVTAGQFYEFDVRRTNWELGIWIPERRAQDRVRSGWDVYTPSCGDAKRLARSVDPRPPKWHAAENPDYFCHYHPAGLHPKLLPNGKRDGYGHVFCRRRGEEAAASAFGS